MDTMNNSLRYIYIIIILSITSAINADNMIDRPYVGVGLDIVKPIRTQCDNGVIQSRQDMTSSSIGMHPSFLLGSYLPYDTRIEGVLLYIPSLQYSGNSSISGEVNDYLIQIFSSMIRGYCDKEIYNDYLMFHLLLKY